MRYGKIRSQKDRTCFAYVAIRSNSTYRRAHHISCATIVASHKPRNTTKSPKCKRGAKTQPRRSYAKPATQTKRSSCEQTWRSSSANIARRDGLRSHSLRIDCLSGASTGYCTSQNVRAALCAQRKQMRAALWLHVRRANLIYQFFSSRLSS